MSCFVLGCQNRRGRNKDLRFYNLPKNNTSFNANRRRLWLQAIPTSTLEDPPKDARVCSAHFISGKLIKLYVNSMDDMHTIIPYLCIDYSSHNI